MAKSKRKLAPGMAEVEAEAEAEAEAEELTTVEERKKVVGSMIEIWCPADKKFYKAMIESYNHGRDRHKVAYVHGDVEILSLNEERWKFVNGKENTHNDPEDRGLETSSPDSSSEMPLQKKIKRNDLDSKKDPSKASDSVTESLEGTPTEEVVRFVKVTKTLNLRVDSFENIDDVKDKFSEFEGIETKVFFTKSGFENDQELDFDRKDGSNVHLNLHLGVRLQVNIKVSWSATADDKLISLDVYSWDTISDVKTKFQNKEGTPANQLTLFYNGKQLDDFQTLAGYDIENHSTLDAFSLGEDKIVISVRILVRSSIEDSIEVMVKLCSTVMTLKRMIHCIGYCAVERQKLMFNGVLLENDQRLVDYKIQKGSELRLVFTRHTDGMQIFVMTRKGGFTICVRSSDTVATLLTEIKNIEDVPAERQKLFFAGKRLENDRTLGDYNIVKDSTIYLHYLRP